MSNIIKQHFTKKIYYDSLVILDRDGTIIKEVGYLNKKEQIKLLPKVADGIKKLNKNNIAVVVVTNQPVVGYNMLSIKELKAINSTIVMSLAQKGAVINGVYSCPHHPDAPNEKYRTRCHCRKPNMLLYKHAIQDFQIKNVLGVIGDTTRDIKFGKNVKATTVLVKTGYKGRDGKFDTKADFVGNNFLECVNILLNLK